MTDTLPADRRSDTEPAPEASLATPYRTETCGALRAADEGRAARLSGWVNRRRDHGQLIFLDLRDRHGITQVVVDRTVAPDAHAAASRVRNEFVVTASGTVARRLPGTENARMATGKVELRADSVEVLNESKTPPFYVNEPDASVDESLRLTYRYLDIRREPMLRRLLLRSALVQAIRQVHHANGFVEIETPLLIKSTAERYPALEAAIRERHPYSVPEIVAWPIERGLPGTLDEKGDRSVPSRRRARSK